MLKRTFILALIFALCLISASWGVPPYISFSGRLTDMVGKPIEETSKNIKFSIWSDLSGGSELWSDTYNDVPVDKGVFNVLLGPIDFSTVLANDDTVYLEVDVDADNAPMEPRQQLVSVPYAARAAVADELVGGSLYLENDTNEPAIYGKNTNSVLEENAGVKGESEMGAGIIGKSTGGQDNSMGVAGFGEFCGVYGLGLTGSAAGVWGNTTNPDGYGGYFSGGKGVKVDGGLEVTGNVGIGTAIPEAQLHITDKLQIGTDGVVGDRTLEMWSEAGYGSIIKLMEAPTYGMGMRYHATDNNLYIDRYQGLDIPEVAITVRRVSGNVGIGTTVPGAKLEVTYTGDAPGNSFKVNDESGDITPFVIDETGNVGIGTTSPGAKLNIVESAADGFALDIGEGRINLKKYDYSYTLNSSPKSTASFSAIAGTLTCSVPSRVDRRLIVNNSYCKTTSIVFLTLFPKNEGDFGKVICEKIVQGDGYFTVRFYNDKAVDALVGLNYLVIN